MEGDQNLRRTATLGALASVAIVIGIVVVVWLVFFRNPAGEDTNSQQGQGSSEQRQDNQSGNGGNEQSGRSESRDQNGATGNNGNRDQARQGQDGKSMPETGPKETALVVVAATVAGVVGYYTYTRRRLAA